MITLSGYLKTCSSLGSILTVAMFSTIVLVTRLPEPDPPAAAAPACNLFLSLADRMGRDNLERFGDSNGRIGI